jgi:hypothetical protein
MPLMCGAGKETGTSTIVERAPDADRSRQMVGTRASSIATAPVPSCFCHGSSGSLCFHQSNP